MAAEDTPEPGTTDAEDRFEQLADRAAADTARRLCRQLAALADEIEAGRADDDALDSLQRVQAAMSGTTKRSARYARMQVLDALELGTRVATAVQEFQEIKVVGGLERFSAFLAYCIYLSSFPAHAAVDHFDLWVELVRAWFRADWGRLGRLVHDLAPAVPAVGETTVYSEWSRWKTSAERTQSIENACRVAARFFQSE